MRTEDMASGITPVADPILSGLSQKEAKKRLSVYGKNLIYESGRTHAGSVAVKLLYDPVSVLLLLSSLVAGIYVGILTGCLIFVGWAINYLVTVLAFFKAESVLDKVRDYGIPRVRVIREGKKYWMDSRYLVPGDILLVESGDILCADAKILRSDGLTVLETDVCGGDGPVEKYASDDKHAVSRSNMRGTLFASSSVISGTAVCRVTATGKATEIVSDAGLLPLSVRQNAELFFRVRRRCRLWGLICTACAALLFLARLYFDPSDLFGAFLLSLSSIAASMSESLLPLSQVAAARQIEASAGGSAGDRLVLKSTGALTALNEMKILMMTDEIPAMEEWTPKKNEYFSVILCRKEDMVRYATRYGIGVSQDIGHLDFGESGATVLGADTVEESLFLLDELRKKHGAVGVLSTRMDRIRLLDAADVAFTYGSFSYKGAASRQTAVENGKRTGNQILSRVCDVLCEENTHAIARSVTCAKGIYATVALSAMYLCTMQAIRILLCALSLFLSPPAVTSLQILCSGLIFDLAAVLCIAFLDRSAVRSVFEFRIRSMNILTDTMSYLILLIPLYALYRQLSLSLSVCVFVSLLWYSLLWLVRHTDGPLRDRAAIGWLGILFVLGSVGLLIGGPVGHLVLPGENGWFSALAGIVLSTQSSLIAHFFRSGSAK